MPTKPSTKGSEELRILEEGAAKFYLYREDEDALPTKSMKVFYNPKMELNRYISNLAVNAYTQLYNKEKLFVINTMAASGVSSLRMLLECDDISKMVINDINPVAVELIKKNLKLNDLPNHNENIIVSRKDANLVCNELAHKKLISSSPTNEVPDVISIDPFGTPNKYLDSAFNAITSREGLLCITATDTAVLFGVKERACHRKYMSKPLHNEFCKEIGTRILLYLISRIANINDLGVLPLLTFYSNHFIRVFALTFNKKKEIFNRIRTYGYIIYCKSCGHRFKTNSNILKMPESCELCGAPLEDFAGPLWTAELHDSKFLKQILTLNNDSEFGIKDKAEKSLRFCLDECGMPVSYYNVHGICHELKKATVPSMDLLIEQIEKQGNNASRTNFDYTSIKTDMNIEELKKLMQNL
jgi:tRNA (guanine26-N2/guanine27-N2)-dimethyltransferase